MCRHLAYLGPETSLAALLLDPPCSLVQQAHSPRYQAHGRINADGFGVGWYVPSIRPEPARYRRPVPMWSDNSFANIAGVISSTAVLAAVRNASPGFPVEETGCAPFARGRWLFSLNGLVRGFHDDIGNALRAELTPELLASLEGVVDTEVLFLMTMARVESGVAPADALADVVRDVFARTTGRLNMLLGDGEHIYATACGDSLFVLHRPGESVVVASEPYDDDTSWQAVPPESVVEAGIEAVTMRPIERGGPG